MYARDKEKFAAWNRIKAGNSKDPLGEIQKEFKARAVFIRALPENKQSKLEVQLIEQLGRPPYKSVQGHKIFILPAVQMDKKQ